MIKNVIFDIGRVLLDFEPFIYLNNLYSDSNLSKLLYEEIFCSKEWIGLDEGSINDIDAVNIFCKRNPNYNKEIMQIMSNWTDILSPIEGTVEVLETLKKSNYKIYLLSNFHYNAFNQVYSKYKFLKLANGIVISSHINLLKPNKEIYNHLLDKYSLKASESIFIDDTLANIEAAKSIDIATIHFKNSNQLKDDLKSLNLL
ncbi:HAD family phosphatase [Clostridium sp. YIM B02515]|uniref:HAD family phosphatase n=1 Tax=Clostridium rhizosphaerae TaxID=2803861 RepID=A0ABS1TBB7_9CLOT|nr:HAD family phosphatase [Clostridium rhizosphaerae]MBL4935288.1 HAD family phosphatase [Clostridium rhizosphaerae]